MRVRVHYFNIIVSKRRKKRPSLVKVTGASSFNSHGSGSRHKIHILTMIIVSQRRIKSSRFRVALCMHALAHTLYTIKARRGQDESFQRNYTARTRTHTSGACLGAARMGWVTQYLYENVNVAPLDCKTIIYVLSTRPRIRFRCYEPRLYYRHIRPTLSSRHGTHTAARTTRRGVGVCVYGKTTGFIVKRNISR